MDKLSKTVKKLIIKKPNEDITLIYYKILIRFVNNLKLQINPNHKNICSSQTNSKAINQYIENLTRTYFPQYLNKEGVNYQVYMGPNMADTSLELTDCIIHLDNKGVEVKKGKKKMTINIMKEKLHAKGVDTTTFKKKREKYEASMLEHKLSDNSFQYETDYQEMFNDHLDQNLHFKSSQTNLYGFKGKSGTKEVEFNGKLPKDSKKPHITFILKHVYSCEQGVTKFVLYSIPHCEYQPEYYTDIQQYKSKNRTPKAPDEFRFNMNDSEGNPYKFIDSDIERYKVFQL